MAFSVNGNGQGGYVQGTVGRFRYRPMSEINVTPFVDVMLVLLIIFMVTAPLLTVGVPVDLPKAKAEQIAEPDEPLVITVNEKGEIFLQETKVTLEVLAPRLAAITENKADTRIYIRGDRKLAYGEIMQVMATATSAGFTRVALITDIAGADGKLGAQDDKAAKKPKETRK